MKDSNKCALEQAEHTAKEAAVNYEDLTEEQRA